MSERTPPDLSMTHGWYLRCGKRVLDLSLAGVLLVLLLPLLIAVGIIVRIALGSPVLFRQRRPGLNGRIFTLLKFRTLTNQCDANGHLRPDAQRMTALGRFLRSSSLDELPELWNVLRGEMSLVGPRPLLVEYLNLYSPKQNRRHEVRPGITGWAQVNGRNAIGWDEKFLLDVWYVDHCQFLLDVKILVMTVLSVLRHSDITETGHVTTSKFLGNEPASIQVGGHAIPEDAVVVIGGGGHAMVVIATLQAAGRNVAAVYDDCSQLWGSEILGVPVVGSCSSLQGIEDVQAIVAVGDNSVRRTLTEKLRLTWISAVHPESSVHESTVIGAGSVICAGAVIQPAVSIGAHVIVNTGATIDHHCTLGSFAHVGPGVHLAGNVNVGEGAMMGIASSAIPGTTIGANTTVGAGGVVINDLPPGVTAVGIPATVKPH